MNCAVRQGVAKAYLLHVGVVHNIEISEGVATHPSYETGEWHEVMGSVGFT